MTITAKNAVRTLCLISLLLVGASWAAGQAKDSIGGVVEKFKQALDRNDYEGMCAVMTEEDGSQALKRINYERMQQSLQDLVSMWRGNPFQYGKATFDPEVKNKATVQVAIINTSQDVKFTLLQFGQKWYIFDIEIYFR